MDIKRKSHNKLIRDKIPEILDEKNIMYEVRTLSSEEYIESLFNKILEEFCEFEASRTIDELADLFEVLHAIKDFYGWSLNDLEKTRLGKLNSNGGFKRKLFLIDTRELVEDDK